MLSLIALAATSALICQPTAKNVCSGGRCVAVQVTTWAQVDPARQTYSRCDPRGCDTYDATLSQSGVFETVEVPTRALIARIGPNGEFLEVATLGTDAYISHGSCRPKE